jgi:hypothetical protein
MIAINYGYDCNKLFVYGNLAAQTTGNCCARWVYHVAPYIRYTKSNGQVVSAVIDPGLFSTVVDATQWMNACKKTTCLSNANYTSYQITEGDVYYLNSNGSVTLYDPAYTKTDCVWQAYAGLSGCTTTPPSTSCN